MRRAQNNVSKGDAIYASLMVDGNEIVCLNQDDFGSINEVLSLIYDLAGQFVGMARLLIRNQSQGWSLTVPIASNPKKNTSTEVMKPKVENGQYLIPW